MNQIASYTPAALYARVSSDGQDVDLPVAAQLRELRKYARKNGYLVARGYVDEAESGRIADRPEFRRTIDHAGRADRPSRRFSSGNSHASPARESTQSPSSPCSRERASALGEGRGRADGRRGPRATQEAGFHRGGACGGAPVARQALPRHPDG